jgi:hypothetical protein
VFGGFAGDRSIGAPAACGSRAVVVGSLTLELVLCRSAGKLN